MSDNQQQGRSIEDRLKQADQQLVTQQQRDYQLIEQTKFDKLKESGAYKLITQSAYGEVLEFTPETGNPVYHVVFPIYEGAYSRMLWEESTRENAIRRFQQIEQGEKLREARNKQIDQHIAIKQAKFGEFKDLFTRSYADYKLITQSV